MADIKIYGRLVNALTNNVLAGAEQVWMSEDSDYNANESVEQSINDLHNELTATKSELEQNIIDSIDALGTILEYKGTFESTGGLYSKMKEGCKIGDVYLSLMEQTDWSTNSPFTIVGQVTSVERGDLVIVNGLGADYDAATGNLLEPEVAIIQTNINVSDLEYAMEQADEANARLDASVPTSLEVGFPETISTKSSVVRHVEAILNDGATQNVIFHTDNDTFASLKVHPVTGKITLTGELGEAVVSVIPTTNVPLSKDVTINVTDDDIEAVYAAVNVSYVDESGDEQTSSSTTPIMRILSDGTIRLQN